MTHDTFIAELVKHHSEKIEFQHNPWDGGLDSVNTRLALRSLWFDLTKLRDGIKSVRYGLFSEADLYEITKLDPFSASNVSRVGWLDMKATKVGAHKDFRTVASLMELLMDEVEFLKSSIDMHKNGEISTLELIPLAYSWKCDKMYHQRGHG